MNDFINEEAIEIEVNGKKFKVHEPDGEEYDSYLESFIRPLPNGNYDYDFKKKNMNLLGFVVDAPYEDKGVKFKDLDKNRRIELLQKLKPGIRGELIKKINSCFEVGDSQKKN